MRSLKIPLLPNCFALIAAARPSGPWFYDSESSCRNDTRATLLDNQNGMCGWCQLKVTVGSSHTDHILPKSDPVYATQTFSVTNLVASCGLRSSTRCGHFKNNKILASWINPYNTARLEDYFTYDIKGKMLPSATLDFAKNSDAADAIDNILNLNESVLMTKRERLISDLLNDVFAELNENEVLNIVGEFKSLIEQYVNGRDLCSH